MPEIIEALMTTKAGSYAAGTRRPMPQRLPREGCPEPEDRAVCGAGRCHLASLS